MKVCVSIELHTIVLFMVVYFYDEFLCNSYGNINI